jgi:hypothetical protein
MRQRRKDRHDNGGNHNYNFINSPQMKKYDYYLTTSRWYKEVISDPYRVMAEFSNAADVVTYRKCIIDAFHAACTHTIWNKTKSGDLLFHFKLIESIVNAAYLVNKEKKKSPVSIEKDSAFDAALYHGRHAGLPAWDFLPRMLSFEECFDPYLVFTRFFKHLSLRQWKRDLQDVVDFALIGTSLSDAGMNFETVPMYIHLTKLMDAAILINVREIVKP